MSTLPHHWITVHRVRHAAPIDIADVDPSGPPAAECWRIGRDAPLDEQGLPATRSAVWGGLALYRNEADARAVLAAPAEHLPMLRGATEAWHALLLPYSHRGDLNWRGFVESGTGVSCGADPGGPLAVLTTIGYDNFSAETLRRFIDMVARVYQVRDFYRTLDGNIRSGFMTPHDEGDGITLTLWSDEAAMANAAYGPGKHQEQLVRHRTVPLGDRTSFTRTRIVLARGTWDGADPMTAFAAG